MISCIFGDHKFKPRNDKDKICYNCYMSRKDDLIEILHKKEDAYQYTIFNVDQVEEAEKFISELCKKDPINSVVGLEGVLNTVEDWRGFTKSVAVCEHVNKLSLARVNAREDIWNRIEKEQIVWGCLIFNRGPYKDMKKSNNFTEKGSKAWVCSLVNPEMFIDCHWDHINSVKSIDISTRKFNLDGDLFALICF